MSNNNDWINAAAQLNSAINNFTTTVESRRQQKQQHKYNKELMKLSQDWQLYMWNLANEYNLPKNEIQRLIDAGINPALAFNNGGASAAPVPSSPESSASIGQLPNLSNPVLSGQQAEVMAAQLEVAESTANKQNAEADAARAAAGESASRKSLNEQELSIRSDPAFISAMAERPGLLNEIYKLDRLTKDLDYSFSLATYGNRVESSDVDLSRNKLGFVSDAFQVRNLDRVYRKLGAEISYLESGSDRERAQAAVLSQLLDIRAGDALMGTLRREAIEYCQTHGVADPVTGEIVEYIDALSREYGAGVMDGIYSSRSKSVVSNEEMVYQKEHGQERRGYETELLRRQGNYYRTSQWNMSLNTALNFVSTVGDLITTVATRGANKAGGSLITPKSGSERMPLSPDAMNVLRNIYPEVEKRMKIY